jgi:excisionase family DNA binding protein
VIITVKEFSDKYKLTRQTVYKWLKEGLPTEMQVGRIIRLDEEKALQWLKENKK